MTNLADLASSAFWRVLPQDADPSETKEWIAAFDAVIKAEGPERATFILRKLLDQARASRVPLPPVMNTPYCNTISLAAQPQYPGNLEVEARLSALVRWNALAMVVRANKAHPELGGHIATYSSAADLFEVGLNHFFRAGQQGDLIYWQPHAAPGVYARAFLEGRLSEDQLNNFRRETAGNGLPSYCHPYLMPDFWQFPTASMGLGPLNAIYQARFMRYLENRGILATKGRKVWCFIGDGEMDEPEAIAGLSIAAREGLDNLIFVINCNLQRLDGPVRGNGSVIQEFEGLYSGAGWNVLKVLWGGDWDGLFARDTENVILKRMHETVDGEFQKYAATDGRFNRENFFNKYPELQAIVAHMSDEDIDRLKRGGHDPVKIYAAYHAAVAHVGQPTVILAQTKKGYGMGQWGQGKMVSHQQKKLDDEALLAFRDRFSLPLSDADVTQLRFHKPADDSPEMKYLHQRRNALGGAIPTRNTAQFKLPIPELSSFAKYLNGTGDRELSTTMVFVQMLSQLLRDKELGKHIVPIVADEARTFGMQSLFRQVAIYSSVGQLYEPEDKDELLYYKETKDGQIIEDGITEAGAISSWLAAGISYHAHGVPMLPFYIFYSMFGFQRVGDLIWAAADAGARGFLLGATAGRTTLSGEGLQHEDGHSHVLASTVPGCVSYDPTFSYEVVVIVQDGMRRMYENGENVFYYVTMMNENYAHPDMPKGAEEGIRRGLYLLQQVEAGKKSERVQLMGSGTILREVIAAAELLAKDFGVASDVWSATSFTELGRDGMACERWNRMHPEAAPRVPFVAQCLEKRTGPVIAASDYMRSFPDQIRSYVPSRFVTLGTDGVGRSDTRANLREFFEVNRGHVVIAALKALADEGKIPASKVSEAIKKYGVDAEKVVPWKS